MAIRLRTVKLPAAVKVAGHMLMRAGARHRYSIPLDAHTVLVVERPHNHRYWRGELVMFMARGTRGRLSVETNGLYSEPTRAAEALTRLLHRWCVADYLARSA
jgi:hypothetical protein